MCNCLVVVHYTARNIIAKEDWKFEDKQDDKELWWISDWASVISGFISKQQMNNRIGQLQTKKNRRNIGFTSERWCLIRRNLSLFFDGIILFPTLANTEREKIKFIFKWRMCLRS